MRQNDNARSINQQASAYYRDRQDPPNHQNGTLLDMNESRQVVRDPRGAGEPASLGTYKNPFYAHREPHRVARDFSPASTGAEPRPLSPINNTRRVLVPEQDTSYDYPRGQPQTRTNPFDYPVVHDPLPPLWRLEPMHPTRPMYEAVRRPMPETPPRKILEPIPADDPYSDVGPQRYREHIPVSEHFYGSAPSTTYHPPERRIVYANPPEEHIVERRHDPRRPLPTMDRNPFANIVRYEPLPESSYMRR